MRLLGALVLAFCLLGTTFGDVFEKSPTATSGQITEGEGQALYGGFGLNAADGAAYNIYRKFGQRDPDVPLQEAENDPGNPSSMTWSGLHHQDTTGIIDPGMFIGTGPATQSDPSQLLYMKPLIDEEGGGNGDSNFRRDWDLRFGFLEDPNAFIDGRAPNDETWDLWSGEWFTDGISAQLNVGNSDQLDETDWYTRMGSGFRLNAAESVFGNEGERVANEMIRTRVGTGDELDEAMNTNSYAGVGYDDAIEISWGLELNDPDNADPVRSREVKFSVKVGNVLHEGVFDPGAADDPMAPNDDGEDYSGGFFDWQNSTPVFFVAPTGGAFDAFGTMGIFIPGDVNADGTVDATDRQTITAYQGELDTTYSRGDIDQDGDTDADDLAAWDAIGGSIPGDFNNNGMLDTGDIDDLTMRSASGLNPATYDLNADALVDQADIKVWVKDLFRGWIGDANLDGEFNSSDLVQVLSAGTYESGLAAVWTTGDFNGDALANSSDLVAALSDGGYEIGPAAAVAVPEPAGVILFAIAWLVGLAIRRSPYAD